MVEISGGLGPTINKVMRIGIMGYNARLHNIERVLKVLHTAQVEHIRAKM